MIRLLAVLGVVVFFVVVLPSVITGVFHLSSGPAFVVGIACGIPGGLLGFGLWES